MHNPASVCPSGVQISIHLVRNITTLLHVHQLHATNRHKYVFIYSYLLGSSAMTIDATSHKEDHDRQLGPNDEWMTRSRFGSDLFFLSFFLLFFTNFLFVCLFINSSQSSRRIHNHLDTQVHVILSFCEVSINDDQHIQEGLEAGREGEECRARDACQWYVFFFPSNITILLMLIYSYVYRMINTSTTTRPTSTTTTLATHVGHLRQRQSNTKTRTTCFCYSPNYN